MRITLASLDLFWIVNQARLLQAKSFLDHYYTTRVRPTIEGIQAGLGTSCYPLHYAVRALQMWPRFSCNNHCYLQLCRAFDFWVRFQFSRKTDILTILSGAGLQSFRAARQAQIPTVVECGSTHTDFQHEIVTAEFRRNGIRQPLFPKDYRDRVRKEFEEADYIQIPTRFVGRTFLEHDTPADKLLYAPFGVDLMTFRAKEELRVDKPFQAICPSGINLRKGARVLAEAWRKLGWTDATLNWIGQPGPESEHLFQKKPDTLIFHNYMDSVSLASLYRTCDVFVLPSFEEGFARVMLEAAASGLAIIVTPNTGAEDFFSLGQPEGWLIPVNDVDALCDAFIEARADREKTFRAGQLATARAQQFSWEVYGARVIENYQQILAGG